MKTSRDGLNRIEAREGVRLKAYKDSVGVWTIGVGHTSAAGPPKVTPNLVLTHNEVDALFAKDLVKYEKIVNSVIKIPITQGEFDALVSLCFNCPVALTSKSSIVRWLNKGDRVRAAQAFLLYKKPPEIIGRRTSEMKQFIAAAPKGV